ncbi:4'-phosphopantetheinyl transferase family protein [Parablautia sp. Marseille-Q6255]|uniref:4'-phosphopantetheinyl transferase family protein n=1 Tax=Parablautia sp. Marseille-Q6255 TaxID=3039593 RepID=UPI0024BCF761|nr:4'-phosphopantetheinyl transferase superfamily protein [Parablautia sp. Marseille-Q6255]
MIYVCEYKKADNRTKQQERCPSLRNREQQTARLLLDAALKQEFGVCLRDLDWKTGANGKPYSGKYPQIHFNISHCACACACAVGLQEVGVDIERLFDYRDGLAKKVSHETEVAVLQHMTEAQRECQLRYLWSLKESFVKWNGRGLGYGVDRISFAQQLPFMPEDGQSLIFDWKQPDTCTKSRLKFLLWRGAAYTLCACAETFDLTVKYIQEEELHDGKTDEAGI